MIHQAILDTNVIDSALRSRRGASFEIIRQISNGAFMTDLAVPLSPEYGLRQVMEQDRPVGDS